MWSFRLFGGPSLGKVYCSPTKTFTTTTTKKSRSRREIWILRWNFFCCWCYSRQTGGSSRIELALVNREDDDSLSSARNRPYWDDWGTSVQRKRGNIGDTQKKNEAKHIFYSFIFAHKTCCLLLNSFLSLFSLRFIILNDPTKPALPIQLQQAAAAAYE